MVVNVLPSGFRLSGATDARSTATAGCRRVGVTASCGGEKASIHGKGVWRRGQTGESGEFGSCTAQVTLLLRDLWFANVGEEPGVGGAALGVVHSGLGEAEFAVYGVSDFRSIGVFLAVVLPPADRTQGQDLGSLQCPVSAARASKTNQCRLHAQMDEFLARSVYRIWIDGSLGGPIRRTPKARGARFGVISHRTGSDRGEAWPVQSARRGKTNSCALSNCNLGSDLSACG